jgi:dTDP-glucose pyrophosphorylase
MPVADLGRHGICVLLQDPERYGVVSFDKPAVDIEEKPLTPNPYAVTGLCF